MELRQLRVFVAVAEYKGFTRAGEQLHLVQSAVSANLRSLEHELGTSLFNRSSQPVTLTEAGSALLDEARLLLAGADAARAAVDKVVGRTGGTVRLGIMPTQRLERTNIWATLDGFAAAHPEGRVVARHTGGSADQVMKVRDGSLDLAIVALAGKAPSGVRLLPLDQEPLVLVCHRDHRLTRQTCVRLADLARETFASLPPTYGTSLVTAAAAVLAGVQPHIRYEVNDIAAVTHLVEHDLAIAVLPASFVPLHPVVRMIPMQDAPIFTTSLAVPTNRPMSPAATALAHTILQLATSQEICVSASGPRVPLKV